MPELDGLDATRIIRRTDSPVRNHAVPIIALTANALESDRERCLQAGMDDFLTKPLSRQALAEKLARHLATSAEPATCPVA